MYRLSFPLTWDFCYEEMKIIIIPLIGLHQWDYLTPTLRACAKNIVRIIYLYRYPRLLDILKPIWIVEIEYLM